jgi:hypothetical protein
MRHRAVIDVDGNGRLFAIPAHDVHRCHWRMPSTPPDSTSTGPPGARLQPEEAIRAPQTETRPLGAFPDGVYSCEEVT